MDHLKVLPKKDQKSWSIGIIDLLKFYLDLLIYNIL